MKRILGGIVAGLSLVGGAAVAFPACVHDDSTLFILDALAQPSNSSSSVCAYTSDPTQAFTSSGVVDYALTGGYTATFLVGNQLVPEVNPTQLMTETSLVNVQGAVVRITKSTGEQIASFTRLTATSIQPSTGTTPGFAPVSVLVLDPTTLAKDPDVASMVGTSGIPNGAVIRFVTYTKVFGKTLGGKDVESNEFEFPIDVCNGCLISYTNSTEHPLPNCVSAPGQTAAVAVLPCLIGQDVPVPCAAVCGSVAICNFDDTLDGG